MNCRYEVRFTGWWIDDRAREDTYSWTNDIGVVAWIRGFLKEACPDDYDRRYWRYVRTVDHITGADVSDDALPILVNPRWEW